MHRVIKLISYEYGKMNVHGSEVEEESVRVGLMKCRW